MTNNNIRNNNTRNNISIRPSNLRRRNPIPLNPNTIRQRFRHLFVRLRNFINNYQLPPIDNQSYVIAEHRGVNILVNGSIYPVLTPEGEVIGIINSRHSLDPMVSNSVLELNSDLPFSNEYSLNHLSPELQRDILYNRSVRQYQANQNYNYHQNIRSLLLRRGPFVRGQDIDSNIVEISIPSRVFTSIIPPGNAYSEFSQRFFDYRGSGIMNTPS